MEKLGIFMRVYNAKPYLEQCISSVLSQSFSDFDFYIVDNGCTDGSGEMLDRYAIEDKRIKLTRYDRNNPDTMPFYCLIQEKDHPYIAVLDSDDWWEPDYLARLLTFMQENDLDISMTGTINYYESVNGSRINRKLERPVIMTQKQYAERYPIYWGFSSTYWGNIMKAEIYKKINIGEACGKVPGYGQDTGLMLHYLEHCSRIGIDNSALYHYRIRESSVSYHYTPLRFDANVGYTACIRSFLEKNNALDGEKRAWLRRVHIAAVSATAEALGQSGLPLLDMLREYGRIASHPMTIDALESRSQELARWRSQIGEFLISNLNGKDADSFHLVKQIVNAMAPKCTAAITQELLPLFFKESNLLDMVLRDCRDELAKSLLDFVAENKYTKLYDLGTALSGLAGDGSPLAEIHDVGFMRKYQDIYWEIWIGHLEKALDMMTGLLLEKKVKNKQEIFLQLYLSVSALQNEAPAFIFGKLRLAELYLRQDCRKECQAVVDELTEMGLDSEELSELRQTLEEKS